MAGLLEVHDPRITPESLQTLRRSGRLIGLQIHQGDGEGISEAGKEQEASTARDAGKRSSDTNGMSMNSAKGSRAKRVWAEVAGALNVSVETVERLIVDRSLRMYDPRVTEKSFVNFCRRHGSLINWEFLGRETRDWLQSSMGLDRGARADAATPLSLFRKHASVVRKCKCGRAIRGNAFFRHVRVCKGSISPAVKKYSL